MEKIFGQQLRELRKTELYDIPEGSKEYTRLVSRKLEDWSSDPIKWMKALARYLCDEHNRLLIVVYDNCDKRDPGVQLGVFERALWIRAEIKCFVLIAMRDDTFDAYSKQPPLDTMQNTFKYYLDPPLFSEVLKKRVKLILDDLNGKASKGTYTGFMGATVTYSADDVRSYLESIYHALFEHDKVLSGLLYGLAGKNIRTAITLFVGILQERYLPGPALLSVKAMSGGWTLERRIVIKALMRGSRRYFVEDSTSLVRNLFQLCHESLPDHFVRWSIMSWLEDRLPQKGPTGQFGFHRFSDLLMDLVGWGHEVSSIESETRYLANAGLIESEHSDQLIHAERDLIKIFPSGHVHVRELIYDIQYLGACARRH